MGGEVWRCLSRGLVLMPRGAGSSEAFVPWQLLVRLPVLACMFATQSRTLCGRLSALAMHFVSQHPPSCSVFDSPLSGRSSRRYSHKVVFLMSPSSHGSKSSQRHPIPLDICSRRHVHRPRCRRRRCNRYILEHLSRSSSVKPCHRTCSDLECTLGIEWGDRGFAALEEFAEWGGQ